MTQNSLRDLLQAAVAQEELDQELGRELWYELGRHGFGVTPSDEWVLLKLTKYKGLNKMPLERPHLIPDYSLTDTPEGEWQRRVGAYQNPSHALKDGWEPFAVSEGRTPWEKDDKMEVTYWFRKKANLIHQPPP